MGQPAHGARESTYKWRSGRICVPGVIGLPIFYYVYFVGNKRGQTYGRRAVGIQLRHESTLARSATKRLSAVT